MFHPVGLGNLHNTLLTVIVLCVFLEKLQRKERNEIHGMRFTNFAAISTRRTTN